MKKLTLLLTAIASLTIASMAHAQDPHLKAFDKVSTDGSQHFYHAVSSKPLSQDVLAYLFKLNGPNLIWRIEVNLPGDKEWIGYDKAGRRLLSTREVNNMHGHYIVIDHNV